MAVRLDSPCGVRELPLDLAEEEWQCRLDLTAEGWQCWWYGVHELPPDLAEERWQCRLDWACGVRERPPDVPEEPWQYWPYGVHELPLGLPGEERDYDDDKGDAARLDLVGAALEAAAGSPGGQRPRRHGDSGGGARAVDRR